MKERDKEKMSILLSVIVPIYNAESYLGKCLDSIATQSYRNLEIILVNDGSTDSSYDICIQYAKKDNRIKVINKKNEGLVAARKSGLSVATGTYVTYVDSDDWVEMWAYQKIMDIAIQNNPEIILGTFVKEAGNIKSIRKDFLKEGFYTQEELYQEIQNGIQQPFYCSVFNLSLCTKVVKRELLTIYQNTVPNEIVMGEDTAVTLPLVTQSHSIYVFETPFYHYVQNKQSMSWEKKSGDYQRWLLLQKYLETKISEKSSAPNLLLKYVMFFEMMLILHDMPPEFFCDGIPFFDQIRRDDRVAMYGKGAYASNLMYVMKTYNLCKIVLNLDSTDAEQMLKKDNLEFDYVIIGVLDASIVNKIYNNLINMGIPEDKIVTINWEKVMQSMSFVLA